MRAPSACSARILEIVTGCVSPSAGCATLRGVEGPVRVGDTVRRPQGPGTAFVHLVLRRLEEAGVTWAPRPLEIDDLGREVQSWIPGVTPLTGDDVDLFALVAIVRELHDLTVDMVGNAECVVHDDIQPRNVVALRQTPVGRIDWEQARPGRRVEDVAKVCWAFIEPRPGQDPVEVGRRWRQVLDAYPLDCPDELVSVVLTQIERCADDIEREAARDSARHRALADRGDHVALRSMHGWVIANEHNLRSAIER